MVELKSVQGGFDECQICTGVCQKHRGHMAPTLVTYCPSPSLTNQNAHCPYHYLYISHRCGRGTFPAGLQWVVFSYLVFNRPLLKVRTHLTVKVSYHELDNVAN